MNSNSESVPYASAGTPTEILHLLIRQTPEFVVPAGPYFNLQDFDKPPESVCDLEALERMLAILTSGKSGVLSGTASNILRYVVAGLEKHYQLWEYCDDFEGNQGLIDRFIALIIAGKKAVDELYGGDTLTEGQLQWIKSEQAQTIRVIEGYRSVLDAACSANEDLLNAIYHSAWSSEKEGGERIVEANWLWDKVEDEYIDLAVVGRVPVNVLNTLRPRYQSYREQDELRSCLYQFLEEIIQQGSREMEHHDSGRLPPLAKGD